MLEAVDLLLCVAPVLVEDQPGNKEDELDKIAEEDKVHLEVRLLTEAEHHREESEVETISVDRRRSNRRTSNGG